MRKYLSSSPVDLSILLSRISDFHLKKVLFIPPVDCSNKNGSDGSSIATNEWQMWTIDGGK